MRYSIFLHLWLVGCLPTWLIVCLVVCVFACVPGCVFGCVFACVADDSSYRLMDGPEEGYEAGWKVLSSRVND